MCIVVCCCYLYTQPSNLFTAGLSSLIEPGKCRSMTGKCIKVDSLSKDELVFYLLSKEISG